MSGGVQKPVHLLDDGGAAVRLRPHAGEPFDVSASDSGAPVAILRAEGVKNLTRGQSLSQIVYVYPKIGRAAQPPALQAAADI